MTKFLPPISKKPDIERSMKLVNYLCPYCNEPFRLKYTVDEHIRKNHRGEADNG